MYEFFQRNPLVVVLGAAALLLVVVIGIETGWGLGLRASLSSAPPLKAAAVDARLLPPLVEAAPEQVYPEMGSRPLFTPTRRPDPVAEAVGSMVKGQFVLQGVTIMGDIRIAMLRDKSGGKVHRVEKGRDLNGITVADIEPDRVTLRQGGDSEVVALVVQKLGGVPGPTPATGPFGAPAPGAAPGAAAPPKPPQPPPAPPTAPATRPPTPAMSTQPAVPGGPMPVPLTPPPAPGTAATDNSGAAMTPEELLARRRARRAQQAQ